MSKKETNFSFLENIVDKNEYEKILNLENKLLDYNANDLDFKVGLILEGFLKTCLIKYDDDVRSKTINYLLGTLKDYLELSNDEIPPSVWLIFDSIKRRRNIASHHQSDENKLYEEGDLNFEQKIDRIYSLYVSLIYLYNSFFSDSVDGIILKSENFNYDVYYDKNNISQSQDDFKNESNDKNNNNNYRKDDHLIDLQKVSISSILASPDQTFFVPAYQRKYSWEESEVLDLLESIKQNKEESFESQYFGAIAISFEMISNSKNEIRLIDGQQRITTSLIIFKVIYDLLINKYNYNEQNLPDYLIELFVRNTAKNKIRSGNKKEYQQEMLEDILDKNNKIIGSKTDSKFNGKKITTNVFMNYKIILDFLEKNYQDGAELLNFIEYFATSYKLAQINFKKDKKEEMQIFENLNSKGMELTTLELIKNTIFLKIKTNDYDQNEDKIVNKFNEKVEFENLIDNSKFTSEQINNLEKTFFHNFLAYQLRSTSQLKKTQKELLLSFNEYLRKNYSNDLSFSEYDEIVEKISQYAKAFLALETREYDTNINHYLHKFSMYLDIFQEKKALTPLYFYFLDIFSSYYDKFGNQYVFTAKNEHLMIKAILEIEKWIVSLMQIDGTGQSFMPYALKLIKVLEYHEEKYYENNHQGFLDNVPKLIRKWLKGELPDDKNTYLESFRSPSKEEFRSSLQDKKVISKFQELILRRIESYYIDPDQKGIGQLLRSYSIEHIFPQNEKLPQSSSWYQNQRNKNPMMTKDDFEIQQSKNINKLGNLILLEQQYNSKISDSEFTKKQLEYQKSGVKSFKTNFVNNQNLLNIDNFDFDTINKRTFFLINTLVDEIYEYD